MNIETTDELSEQLADWFGIYGGCKSDGESGCKFDEKNPFCCRQGFVDEMKERMIKAVDNDKKIEALGL